MREPVEIVPPKHGLHDGAEFSRQPPLTTSLSKNMRTQQAKTSKLRSSSRAGYRKFNTRVLLKNYLAYTEDFGHFRDTTEGDLPFPSSEGWLLQSTGAKSFSSVADGTLGPDLTSTAQLAKQLLASGGNRASLTQQFDVNNPATGLASKVGATFVRTAGDLMFSVYKKASDATATQLTLRQGSSAGLPLTTIIITWTAGVPAITTTTTDGPGNHPSGFTDEGNGWYRFWVGVTWNAGAEVPGPTLRPIILPNQADTTAKGVYLFGAQLEVVPSGTTEPTRYEPVLGRNDTTGKRKAASLTAVTHIQKKLEYRRKPASLVATKSYATPSKQSAQHVVYDRQRNRYVLEPQAVVKFSSKGDLVFSIPVPIADPAHVCQALHVDEEDQIYVGVTSGGDSLKARLFCFRQGPEVVGGVVREDSFHLHWTVETAQYVISIRSRDGVLYTTQDDPVTKQSELVTYDALDFAEPDEAARRTIPYPSAGFWVKADASVVTCHPTNATRGLDPSSNGSDTLGPWPTAVGWTPQNDLANWREDCWTWIDSEFLNGPGLRTRDTHKQGDPVEAVVDLTGHERNAFASPGPNDGTRRNDTNNGNVRFGNGPFSDRTFPTRIIPPLVNLKGMNGVPSLFFNGVDMMLESNPNPGTDETNLDLHRSLFPSYDGSKFTAFVVFRPTYKARITALLSQYVVVGVGDANKSIVLCTNRADQQSPAGSDETSSRGRLCLVNDTSGTADPATGTGASIVAGSGPNDFLLESGGLINFCVATIKCGPGADESLLRFNGTQAEAGYSSPAFASVERTYIGNYVSGGFQPVQSSFYDGELFAIIVYKRLLTSTEIELHEGYLANRYGGQGRLDAAHPYKITPAVGLALPSNAPLSVGKADPNQLNHRSTILAKFAPGGELKWTATDFSGVGFDVIGDDAGNLFSFGEYDDTEGGDYLPTDRGRKGWLRKVLDNGDSVDADDLVADWTQNKVRVGATSASKNFASAFWTATDVTVASGSTTDPFGTSQADTLTDGAAGGAGTLRHDFVTADLLDASDYTLSIYLKQSTATAARIKVAQVGGTGSATQVDFDFTTRALTGTPTGTGRRHQWDLEDVGNGWFRLQASLNFLSADSGTFRVEITPDTSGTQKATFAYGCMFERNQTASTFAYDSIQQKHTRPPSSQSTAYPRLDMDTFGNIYVPGPFPIPTASPNTLTLFTARVYDKNLYLVGDLDLGRLATDDFRGGRAVAVNREPPSYKDSNPGVWRNLLGFTERFDNAYWSKTSVAVTVNARIAPDGTATADTLDDSSASVIGTVIRDVTGLDDGEVYTLSVHLSPQDATTSRLTLEHTGGVRSTQLLITWNAGTKRAPTLVATNLGTGVHTFEIKPAAMGFFRLSVSATYSAALGALRVRIEPDGTTANTGAVSAWGAQIERADHMTRYQRVDGRQSFAPKPIADDIDPIGITDSITVVTPNDDLESASTSPLAAVHEIDLVDSEPNGLPARDTKLVTVTRGSLILVDRVGEPQIPRGGSSCLNPAARYISATSLFQRVIATDGTRSVIYQPGVDGQVRPYVATKGEVPEGVELWAAWRGRPVAARTRDDPHAWFMGAIENLFDWDYFTPPLRSDKAVFSTTSRAGLAPDAINTIIPYDDQRIIFGCDHAIWYLPADPLSEMAQWQQISDITGIAFGNNSWCKDPSGVLYFFGSRGGFYRVAGDLGPESLTTETIERRLRDIDLDQFYVELYWNWREEGVHIYVIPYGSPSTIVKHFFWGKRFNEWREDEQASVLVQPTSGVILDGDLAKDRRLLYVNGNLNVLEWDENTKTDDGQLIDSKELMGPYDVPGEKEARWEDLTVLLSEDSDGARYEFYSADSADALGPIRASGTLGPGRNSRKPGRTSGAKFWLLLGSNVLGEAWAFEQGTIFTAPAGRARVR